MATCENCDSSVSGKGKYCSNACKQAAYRGRTQSNPGGWRTAATRAIETKKGQALHGLCAQCGTDLELNGLQGMREYCSAACRQAAYRERRDAKLNNCEASIPAL